MFVGEKYKNGLYTVLRKLGWGHFSTVWLVINNETQEYGAMKVSPQAHCNCTCMHLTERCMTVTDCQAQGRQPGASQRRGVACMGSLRCCRKVPPLTLLHDLGLHDLQVQKSAKHYTEAAYDEITLLSQIRDGDPNDTRHCVRLIDSFEHTGPHGRHVCMVFEVRSSMDSGDHCSHLICLHDGAAQPRQEARAQALLVAPAECCSPGHGMLQVLGENLLALIKQYDYRGIPIPVVRNLARQMLIGLDYLHRWGLVAHPSSSQGC